MVRKKAGETERQAGRADLSKMLAGVAPAGKIKADPEPEQAEEKTKRSYMLTDNQIKYVHLLKSEHRNMDLSDIVGMAIEECFRKRFPNYKEEER